MKILLFSTLLALAAANVLPGGMSRPDERPGMCRDFFRKQALESADDTAAPGEAQGRPPKKYGGHRERNYKPWLSVDLSELRPCSRDQDCEAMDKCCRTVEGMRCTKAVFDLQNKVPEKMKPGKWKWPSGGKYGVATRSPPIDNLLPAPEEKKPDESDKKPEEGDKKQDSVSNESDKKPKEGENKPEPVSNESVTAPEEGDDKQDPKTNESETSVSEEANAASTPAPEVTEEPPAVANNDGE